MKRLTIIITIIITGMTTIYGQATGIHFEKGTTWDKVLQKAKAEHKYIFVDCYTTWCAPCKNMAANIYPLKEVGDAYIKNFISVKVQMDKTKTDNDEIKGWYDIADMLTNNYAVNGYPTFLFFDADGKPVHKVAGALNVKGFIQLAADAQNPEKQYYQVLKNFQPGKLGTAEEKGLAMAFAFSDKELAGKIAADYLSRIPAERLSQPPNGRIMANMQDNPQVLTIALNFIQTHEIKPNLGFIAVFIQHAEVKDWAVNYISKLRGEQFATEGSLGLVKLFYNQSEVKASVKKYLDGLTETQLYTKVSIGYLVLATHSPDDVKGFDVFYHHAAQVDSLMGKGFAHDQVEAEIEQTEFRPLLDKAKQNGIMPNFQTIQDSITKKYDSNVAEDIAVDGKVDWFYFLVHSKKEDQYWYQLIDSYIVQIDKGNYETDRSQVGYVNGVSYDIYLNSNDPTQLAKASQWMSGVIQIAKDGYQYGSIIDTYACLLFKAGYVQKGVAWETKALQYYMDNKSDFSPYFIGSFKKKIAAMKRREPIWNEKEYQ